MIAGVGVQHITPIGVGTILIAWGIYGLISDHRWRKKMKKMRR